MVFFPFEHSSCPLCCSARFHVGQSPCYDFPFFPFILLSSFHFIPLRPYSFLFLCHFSMRLSSFFLSMTHSHEASFYLPSHTALHCLMTHIDSFSPQGCTSPLFPFHLTSYDSTLIFYWTTLCPTIYI